MFRSASMTARRRSARIGCGSPGGSSPSGVASLPSCRAFSISRSKISTAERLLDGVGAGLRVVLRGAIGVDLDAQLLDLGVPLHDERDEAQVARRAVLEGGLAALRAAEGDAIVDGDLGGQKVHDLGPRIG